MKNLNNKKIVEVDVTLGEDFRSSEESLGIGNDKEQQEQFKDMALGMFIHWGLDSMIGSVISHWMIGADEKIVDDFIEEMPKNFEPYEFDARKIARLARQAGMKYGVFTAKHHTGFCMYNTKTTDFSVKNTPLKRDFTKEFFEAFREYGIEPGLYFSPLDFYWCRKNDKKLEFLTPHVLPKNNPGLMEYNKEQVNELLSNYGDIYCMFFDGPPEQLREMVWKKNKKTLVTRGEMETPEQNMPENMIGGTWEACYTIGDGWSYKPTNETYKTGNKLIKMLIEIRAKGGNLLLNVAIDPDGKIPTEQERLLRELGLFMFFNSEAIYKVRPWSIQNDGDSIWYTKAKDEDAVYAYIMDGWKYGLEGRKWVTLPSVQISENTEVTMVGQNDILEHKPGVDTKMRFHQDECGLHVSAVRCYRPYDNRQWNNPVVLKITGARAKK